MDNSLNFYRWLVEKLVQKEDQLVTEGADADEPKIPPRKLTSVPKKRGPGLKRKSDCLLTTYFFR